MSVFNTKRFVEEAIGSVLTQTFDDLELIVIDDGSTDGGWSVIENAAAGDRRVLPLRCERQRGASAALNEGLSRARGQYITRQDSDDRSVATRLAEQIGFLERHPHVGAVGTSIVMMGPEGEPFGRTDFPERDADIQAKLLDQMCFCGPTLMVRSEAFQRAGYWFDETLSGSEDYDLCLRLAEVTSLANVMQPLYLYRQHAASVSHSLRYHQLCRKASAAEKAVLRRVGTTGGAGEYIFPARDYLRAAVVAHGCSDGAFARDCVSRATKLEPRILEQTELIIKMVRTYAPRNHDRDALQFTESLFREVIPSTPRLEKVRRRILSELHMQQVFKGKGRSAREHFWKAIRNNPALLGDPGTLSLLLRLLLVDNHNGPNAKVSQN